MGEVGKNAPKLQKKTLSKHCVLSPLRTLSIALSMPCPWQLSALGPFRALPVAVLDLSMGGGRLPVVAILKYEK